MNSIINYLNSEYFSQSLEESENSASNYSTRNQRLHKRKKTTIRKLNSQNIENKDKEADEKKNNIEENEEVKEEHEKKI